MLQILSPQVVIYLENARLVEAYQEMQERRQAEEQREEALEALRANEAELRQLNEHLAGYQPRTGRPERTLAPGG